MPTPVTAPISSNVNVPPRPTLGPIAGSIIIALTVLIGGMYFWGMYLNNTTIATEPTSMASDEHTTSKYPL